MRRKGRLRCDVVAPTMDRVPNLFIVTNSVSGLRNVDHASIFIHNLHDNGRSAANALMDPHCNVRLFREILRNFSYIFIYYNATQLNVTRCSSTLLVRAQRSLMELNAVQRMRHQPYGSQIVCTISKTARSQRLYSQKRILMHACMHAYLRAYYCKR